VVDSRELNDLKILILQTKGKVEGLADYFGLYFDPDAPCCKVKERSYIETDLETIERRRERGGMSNYDSYDSKKP